tara:strand:- start:398 stop:1384 length:987 start_codon:yes stop_codon:yes gene_type:complete
MKIITKGEKMNNLKKVGLTALAGSLAAFSANAAELSVSGATVLTYTSEDASEVTGNPFGMKTNVGFAASGEVNGYDVSYFITSADQFGGMSSARLSVDLGDMGTLAFDQGSGSGLATIDDKTPTAAEEIWDGLDAKSHGGLVGTAGSSGVFNYINTFAGVNFNAALRKGGAGSQADGASSGAGEGAWDFAATTSLGDSLAVGAGWGEETGADGNDHSTIFANYTLGMATVGYQYSHIVDNAAAGVDEVADAMGLAVNLNENLSVSIGKRNVEYKKSSTLSVTEEGTGVAVAYTMGSVKIAGNRNEVKHNQGVSGAADSMTEVAVSFAF